MIELVMSLIKIVMGKTADIVKHQFGIICQGQAACCCIAEKLVTEATDDAGYDFGGTSQLNACLCCTGITDLLGRKCRNTTPEPAAI